MSCVFGCITCGLFYTSFYLFTDMVGMVLGGGSDVETAKERLREKMPAIKKIAADFKKSAGEKS